jgi:Helix-turn-helix domain
MAYSFEEIATDSPYTRAIFRMRFECDGSFMTNADGSADLLLVQHHNETRLLVNGTRTKAARIFYKKDMEFVGIRLEVGTFLPKLPAAALLDSATELRAATAQSCWLHDTMLPLPDFETMDAFVERLTRYGLIARDETVEAALQEQPHPKTLRSVQRHFLKTTGMTQRYVGKVERALQAGTLLRQGVSIADTLYQVGYFDQAHMTRALKHLLGYTPAQLSSVFQP